MPLEDAIDAAMMSLAERCFLIPGRRAIRPGVSAGRYVYFESQTMIPKPCALVNPAIVLCCNHAYRQSAIT